MTPSLIMFVTEVSSRCVCYSIDIMLSVCMTVFSLALLYDIVWLAACVFFTEYIASKPIKTLQSHLNSWLRESLQGMRDVTGTLTSAIVAGLSMFTMHSVGVSVLFLVQPVDSAHCCNVNAVIMGGDSLKQKFDSISDTVTDNVRETGMMMMMSSMVVCMACTQLIGIVCYVCS